MLAPGGSTEGGTGVPTGILNLVVAACRFTQCPVGPLLAGLLDRRDEVLLVLLIIGGDRALGLVQLGARERAGWNRLGLRVDLLDGRKCARARTRHRQQQDRQQSRENDSARPPAQPLIETARHSAAHASVAANVRGSALQPRLGRGRARRGDGHGRPAAGSDLDSTRASSALIVALLLLVLLRGICPRRRFRSGRGARSGGAVAGRRAGRRRLAVDRDHPRGGATGGDRRIALLAGFAAWSGLTVLWSVAPNQTWLEFNRDLGYVIVLLLAVAAGASHRRAVETFATGYLLVALVVAVYAIGQKVAPGLHINGLFDLNQTSQYARLQAPLDYWNALALFLTFAVPIALVIAIDQSRPRRIRIASLLSVELLLLVIGLTYSRGGLIALAVAVAVSVRLGGAWLKTLVVLGAAAVAAALPLVMALSDHALSGENIPVGQREVPGGQLAIVLLVSLALLYVAGRRLLDLERRVEITPQRARGTARLLVAGLGFCLLIGLILVALSSRGLSGSVSHAWHSFTTPAGSNVNNPNVSFSSGYRWVWWKEALGAWSDRPFGGWGAGSFEILDLLYRTTNAHVQDAHSVPLQWLAETGIVGGLLAVGGYGLLLVGGLDAVRRRSGAERALAAALLAGAVAYAVHAFYDWDWDMPGVTFPVLIFLGVLAGSAVDRRRRFPGRRRWPAGMRGLGLGICTFALCVYAVSAVLPSLASTKASAALTTAGATSSRATLARAEASADLASRLDPLSDAGLTAAASISVYLGHPAEARSDLVAAVRRDPSDELAWEQLAALELSLRDVRATRQATERVLQLDPHGAIGRQLMLDLAELSTPPNNSATATSTPLPVG